MGELSNKLQGITIVLTHIVTLLGLIMMIIWCQKSLGGYSVKEGEEFNWHPTLMYFGFIFCFGHAALAYRTLPFSHFANKIIHFVLQTIGIISVTVGLIAVIKFHNAKKFPNFYSMHSWLGIFVYAVFCVQYLGSIFAFLIPKASEEVREKAMPWHVAFGSWLYIAVGIVCLTGIQEKLGFLSGVDACNQFSYACTLGNSLGVVIFAAILFMFLSLRNFNKAVSIKHNDYVLQ